MVLFLQLPLSSCVVRKACTSLLLLFRPNEGFLMCVTSPLCIDDVHVTSLFTCYSSCVCAWLLLWERLAAPSDPRITSWKKQSEFLPLFEKSCKASTVDFSCWVKELSPGYAPMLFAHTGSPAKQKTVGDLLRYWRSQATKRGKIGAEPCSCRSADEEDSESNIGNGVCECSIMTDLSGKDILKLQDELQVFRSKNCRLTNSEC